MVSTSSPLWQKSAPELVLLNAKRACSYEGKYPFSSPVSHFRRFPFPISHFHFLRSGFTSSPPTPLCACIVQNLQDLLEYVVFYLRS